MIISGILCLIIGVIAGIFAPKREDLYASIAAIFNVVVVVLFQVFFGAEISIGSLDNKIDLFSLAVPVSVAFFLTLLGGVIVGRIRKFRVG
jgi:uncharacterized membrane protein